MATEANERYFQHEILHAVKTNSVVLIHGPCGSGKTTQVPQYILDSYLNLEQGAECCILVAQPRRISAICLAARVAKERSEPLGTAVGYEVPFEAKFPRPYGCILFCTLDILLKRLETGIQGVSHIILDGIHERNAKSDFALAVLLDMVKAFPQLRIILISAATDITPIKEYFPTCVDVKVPFNTNSVLEYYLEDIVRLVGFLPRTKAARNENEEYCDKIDDNEDSKSLEYLKCSLNNKTYSLADDSGMRSIVYDLIMALLVYVKSLKRAGAILVFLPDCDSISILKNRLLNHSLLCSSPYICLPLHSEISQEEMECIFHPVPSNITKIILATSIGETAFTLKDVVFVIDSCKTVIKRFTYNNNAVNYTPVWASKCSLEQRARQASFVQAGCYFRLCTRECFAKLKNDIIPEIH